MVNNYIVKNSSAAVAVTRRRVMFWFEIWYVLNLVTYYLTLCGGSSVVLV